MALVGPLVQLIAAFQYLHILPTVSLRWRHVPNAAVAVHQVVPMHESRRPGPRIAQVRKSALGIFRAVFGRSEQHFHKRVVVAHPGSRVRGFNPQPVQHRQHRRGFQRSAVVAMQHGLAVSGRNPFGQGRALHQASRVIGIIFGVHLPAHHLAAVQVHDQIQVKPTPSHGGWQVGQARGRLAGRTGHHQEP
jgi:hypothetical protein